MEVNDTSVAIRHNRVGEINRSKILSSSEEHCLWPLLYLRKPTSCISGDRTLKMSSNNSTKNPTVVHRKIAFLGFRAVGKSSLVNSFVSGTFSDA